MRSSLTWMGTALLGLILLASGSAAALTAPARIAVRPEVSVKQREVFLANICDPATLSGEWQAILGGLNIGDAPPPGSEKFVDPAQLRAYLVRVLESQGVEPAKVALEIPEKIVVRRESAQISQEQVEDIFKKYIFENSPWSRDDIVIQRVHYSGVPLLPVGNMTYEIIPGGRERFMGTVTASIQFYVDGEKARTLGVTGRVEVFANVYHASRPIRRDETITPADLELKRTNVTDSADRFAMRLDEVENRRAVRDIGVRQPIELKDIDKPLVVKRGDPVVIVYDQPGIQITAKGRAGADGGIGDTLAVVNTSSKKTIYCKVLDAQTVRAVR